MTNIDVNGAAVHTIMWRLIHVIFDGKLVKIRVKSNPGKYGKYLTNNSKVESVMWVEMKILFYGCLESAQLLWEISEKMLSSSVIHC